MGTRKHTAKELRRGFDELIEYLSHNDDGYSAKALKDREKTFYLVTATNSATDTDNPLAFYLLPDHEYGDMGYHHVSLRVQDAYHSNELQTSSVYSQETNAFIDLHRSYGREFADDLYQQLRSTNVLSEEAVQLVYSPFAIGNQAKVNGIASPNALDLLQYMACGFDAAEMRGTFELRGKVHDHLTMNKPVLTASINTVRSKGMLIPA